MDGWISRQMEPACNGIRTRICLEVAAANKHSQPVIQTELANKTPSLNHPQNGAFCFVGGSDSCYIGCQQLYFHQMALNKVIRDQEGVPTQQSGFRPQKRPGSAKNTPSQNHHQNSIFPSARGSDSCYIGYQPIYDSCYIGYQPIYVH